MGYNLQPWFEMENRMIKKGRKEGRKVSSNESFVFYTYPSLLRFQLYIAPSKTRCRLSLLLIYLRRMITYNIDTDDIFDWLFENLRDECSKRNLWFIYLLTLLRLLLSSIVETRFDTFRWGIFLGRNSRSSYLLVRIICIYSRWINYLAFTRGPRIRQQI